jgi:hypothetical protein
MVLSTGTLFLHSISNGSVSGTEVFEFSVLSPDLFHRKMKICQSNDCVKIQLGSCFYFFVHVQIFDSFSTTQCLYRVSLVGCSLR